MTMHNGCTSGAMTASGNKGITEPCCPSSGIETRSVRLFMAEGIEGGV
jgi:hypothetical protein